MTEWRGGDGARLWVVVPAAGVGSRFGSDLPKQYTQILGRTVLEHVLDRLGLLGAAGVVVARAARDPLADEVLEAARSRLPALRQCIGGSDRARSVLAGLESLTAAAPDDWAMVHDAARPCVRLHDCRRLLAAVDGQPGGALLAVPVTDTLKSSGEHEMSGARVVGTVDRSGLWRAMTPQLFRVGALADALRAALESGRAITDEAAAMEAAGVPVRLVVGSADNLKLTFHAELPMIEAILRQQAAEVAG